MKRRRKTRVKRAKDVSEWGVPEWRASLQGKEFTDDDSVRRVIIDVVFLMKRTSTTLDILLKEKRI